MTSRTEADRMPGQTLRWLVADVPNRVELSDPRDSRRRDQDRGPFLQPYTQPAEHAGVQPLGNQLGVDQLRLVFDMHDAPGLPVDMFQGFASLDCY